MLRRALVAASGSATLRRLVTEQPAARAVAMRFVAGETLEDALAVTRRLNDRGMSVSLDELGEAVDDETVARRAAESYIRTLDTVAAAGVDASISVKPSQLGLDIGYRLCRELLDAVCASARAHGNHVTVDMEGSDHTEATVDLVADLHAAGHRNVGCAVQSYLHRTPDDVARLTAIGASLRLCKGAYAEPAEVAHQDRVAIAVAYARLAEALLGSGTYPRLATHDHRLVRHAQEVVRRLGLGPDDFEFQMLYGVREPLQQELVDAGWRLRVYVPFGTAWYPYLVRRLAERPANVAFFLRALVGRRS